ncbi:MAG: hypothetical protein PHR44_02190 [Candidatus Omnitrophica bacterium]|nr:hypothetical protein [Candidatus Omnitrophota bacterium]
MKKTSMYILFFIAAFSFNLLAKEAYQNQLILELNFPKESTAKMEAPRPKAEALSISGEILVNISPVPEKIEQDRYLVEYFLDEQLIYRTTGFDRRTFACILDTAQYENGTHKLIINFWDKSGPSAIGIRELIINNEETNE